MISLPNRLSGRKNNISSPNRPSGKEIQDFLTKPAVYKENLYFITNRLSGEENQDFLTKPGIW